MNRSAVLGVVAVLLTTGCGDKEMGSVISAEDAALKSLADRAMMELAKPSSTYVNKLDLSTQTHHVFFFEDEYAISALTTAYTKTGDAEYLNTSKAWVEKIIAYQRQMMPTGAYFPKLLIYRAVGTWQSLLVSNNNLSNLKVWELTVWAL